MREFNLLIWMTQLGLSIAMPLGGFLFLGLWLYNSVGWGQWTIWLGLVLGLTGAINGFRDSMRAMERMSKGKDKPEPPPVAFNDHH